MKPSQVLLIISPRLPHGMTDRTQPERDWLVSFGFLLTVMHFPKTTKTYTLQTNIASQEDASGRTGSLHRRAGEAPLDPSGRTGSLEIRAGGRLRLSTRTGNHIGNALTVPLNPSRRTVRTNWSAGKTRWVVTGPVKPERAIIWEPL